MADASSVVPWDELGPAKQAAAQLLSTPLEDRGAHPAPAQVTHQPPSCQLVEACGLDGAGKHWTPRASFAENITLTDVLRGGIPYIELCHYSPVEAEDLHMNSIRREETFLCSMYP